MERTLYSSKHFHKCHLISLFKIFIVGIYMCLHIQHCWPPTMCQAQWQILSRTWSSQVCIIILQIKKKKMKTAEGVKGWSWDLNHVLRFQDLGSFSHNMLLPWTSEWVGICPEVPPENPCCSFLPVPHPPSARRDLDYVLSIHPQPH